MFVVSKTDGCKTTNNIPEHRTLYLLQGASEKNAGGLFPSLLFFFFYWQGAWGEGLGCIYVSAGNVQQSVLFHSVPSSGLVLVINDKSVLVFLNVTLCDGFVGIRVL